MSEQQSRQPSGFERFFQRSVRRALIGLAVFVIILLARMVIPSGGDAVEDEAFDAFTTITDCRELERLASVEVDRINTATDQNIVNAATDRFQRIVNHRDSVC